MTIENVADKVWDVIHGFRPFDSSFTRGENMGLIRNYRVFCCAAAAAVCAVAGHARASVITPETPDTSTGENFVSAGYTAAGYALFGTSSTGTTSGGGGGANPLTQNDPLVSQPSSLGLTLAEDTYAGEPTVNVYYGYGFNYIQNPAGSPAYDQCGEAGFKAATANQIYGLFSLSFSSTPTSVVRFTVVPSNGTDAPTEVILSQSITAAGETAAAPVTFTPTQQASGSGNQTDGYNYYTYDITGAQAGDVFDLSLETESNGSGFVAALGFSSLSPTPEPASLSVLAVGAFGLLARRRRSPQRS